MTEDKVINTTCRLVIPDESMCDEIISYRQEFIDEGRKLNGCGPLMQYKNPLDWLSFNKWLMVPENVEGTEWSPATQFVYVRECDNKIIGTIQVRNPINDFLRQYGGNIGYSVRASERRKGYATAMLKEALDFCRKSGMDKVMISCSTENEASRKTILACNGIYYHTVYCSEKEENLEIYWISL